ncbi:MAG TPA: PLDc N-terminal domain-containing protein [Candidatus Acidoferrum sp.]|nr:PLDc N-terminal domain-containing protein [Candidatus Acidoferrum sp.]
MLALLGGGILGMLIGLIFLAFGLAACIFWIWMLIHAITNEGLSGTEKIVWVLVIIFLHFLGALIYFFVGKSKGTG